MNYKNIFLVTLVAVPLTVLEVSAAGNSDKLKDTIIDKTIQKFEDGFNSLFTNTELAIEGRTGSDPNFTLLTVNPITEDEAEGNLTFFQGSIIRQNNRDTINLGIGYRQLSDDEKWIYGINAFHDYENTYEHSRWSVGAELRSSAFEINANKYFAISGAKTGKNGNTERALDGYEIEDTKGNTYSLQINAPIAPNITLEAGTKDFDTGTDVDFVNLTYKIGLGGGKSQQDEMVQSLIADQAFNTTSMKDKMLEKVRRKNQIVIQTGFTASAGGV